MLYGHIAAVTTDRRITAVLKNSERIKLKVFRLMGLNGGFMLSYILQLTLRISECSAMICAILSQNVRND